MADTKIASLSAGTAASTDRLPTAVSPFGAGNNAYLTLAAIDTFLSATTKTLTNKTIDLGSNTVTMTSLQLKTALSDETGSGAAVFATSPTLVTPALGTPSSGVMTNVTGTAAGLTAGNVTTNANLTGPITSVGNATAIASQTGTGSKFVVDTSPTLVTPLLGTPTSGNLANCTGYPASSVASGAALTKTDDTNVTLTLGGTPTSALLVASSLTLGWTGTLAVARGGLGAGTFTAHGILLGQGTSAVVPTAAMTDGQLLVGQSSADPLPKTLSGDATLSAAGALTLASTISAAGPIGSATVAPIITFDAKGRLTTVTSATVTPAVGSITGLGTGVGTFLATPSSANLASAITDETGSGALVFGTSPTFTTTTLHSYGGSAVGLFGATSNYNVYSLNNSIALNGSLGMFGGAGGDANALYLSAPTSIQLYLSGASHGTITSAGAAFAQQTAIPAGGTAGLGVRLSTTANFGVFFGSGAPTLAAAQGSLYIRSDGSSTSTRLYINTNGSTTWTNVTTAA